MNFSRVKYLCFSALFVLSVPVWASVENVGTYNLILKNDLSTSSDIEGRIMIGGNINGSSTDVGSRIPLDADVDAVTVVGDINAPSLKAQNGHIVYGGNANTNNLITNSSTGQVIKEDQSLLQTRFDEIYQSVIDDSYDYKNLASNGTFNTSDQNKKLFESDSTDDVLVFNIDGDDLRYGGLEFNFMPTVPIIINVAGTGELNINAKAQGNYFNKNTVSPLVLWNFYDYTKLRFNGDGWNGSVLAPYADISSYTGSLDGGIAALSYTGGVELHNKLFTFEPNTSGPKDEELPVPVPSTWLMFTGGFLLLLRQHKRHKPA
ncbi:MAG: choice-of-anchor A family protein [Alteromonadaceae bacterium]|nr:choice-of-anchor A family protein [Alteromonadaceae bacterium]